MTEPVKKPAASAKPETVELIELVSVIDWRWIAVAAVVAVAGTFIVLSLIEHTDDKPSVNFDNLG